MYSSMDRLIHTRRIIHIRISVNTSAGNQPSPPRMNSARRTASPIKVQW